MLRDKRQVLHVDHPVVVGVGAGIEARLSPVCPKRRFDHGQIGTVRVELNRPDVAAPDPWLPKLVRGRTDRVVARIDGPARGQQGEIPLARGAIIGEGL